jgi:hypothetical protein
MKIVLYIDPLYLSISYFHTIYLLKEYFENKECIFDICIPDYDKLKIDNIKIKDCFINKEYAKKYNYNINWFNYEDKINPKKYDILLLLHMYGKWNLIDNRKIMMENFKKQNKKIMTIKSDMTLEYRYLDDTIIYCVNSSNLLLDLPSRWILRKNSNILIVPVISNLLYEKRYALTKEDFYKKYNLNKNNKNIIFFMGNVSKFYNKLVNIDNSIIHSFIKNIKLLIDIFKNLNYNLIFKLHRTQEVKIIEDINLINFFNNIIIIKNEDTHELIKYSERAISYNTCMVYELYLYNLPVLELGDGIYFPGWISCIKKYNIYKSCPLKDFNYGKDLIYGTILNNNFNKKNYNSIINLFINQDFNIKKYKYLNNHPIYGDSYNKNINNVGDIIYNKMLTL